MSAEIKLQAGQWYRTRGGEIVYCVGQKPIADEYPFIACLETGGIRELAANGCYWANRESNKKDIIEHLPDCTGFDWVPPKRPDAPEGWRWLEDEEKIQDGDRYWNKKLEVPNFLDSVWVYINYTCNHAKVVMPGIWGVLRKIEPKLQLREGAWYERKSGDIVGPCKKRTDGLSCNDHHWVVGNASYQDDGTSIYNPFVNLIREVDPPKPPQPKYRAFKWEEREQLRGKVVIVTEDDAVLDFSIDCFIMTGDAFYIEAYTSQQMLEKAKFADGSVVGVLDDE
jgi:hypothetical protein